MTVAFDKSMRTYDQDGRLRVEKTVISIANVCPYYGREISNWQELGLDADKIYDLYRDRDELEKAAPTYHNVPLLAKHIAVSAEAPKKEFWVGTVSDISFENPKLYGSLAVWDAHGISLVESGAQEQLSAGYYFKAVMTPGIAPDGKRFDGRMTNLVCNHVALVAEGRVGPDSTIADQQPKGLPMPSKYTALAAFLKPDADILAFDAAMDAEKEKAEDAAREEAEDKAHDCYGKTADEWGSMSAEDKKGARDEWKKAEDKKAKDAKAKDSKAKDGDVDHRDDFKSAKDSAITQDQLNTAVKASGEAVRKQMLDLFTAREAVKPIVGVVAMDSADEVYAFALKHAGVKIDGVPAAAFPAMLDLVKSRKPAQPAVPAFDSAATQHSVSAIWH